MNIHCSDTKVYRYKVLQAAVGKFGQSLARISSEQRRQAERIALRQMALEGKILASAEARQTPIPTSKTETAIAEIVARYASEEEFISELKDNQLDYESLRDSVNQELLVEAVMNSVAFQVPEISDTDACLYYYFHQEKFQRGESRTARHILITINPDFPENTRTQAKARISLIAKRLKRKPERFAEQAAKHSECPTAMEGGLLGRINPGMLFPQLDKALFALSPGHVSDVVESEVGFHILLCEAIFPAGMMAIDEVVGAITEKLTAKKREKHQQEWLKTLLRSEQEVDVNGQTDTRLLTETEDNNGPVSSSVSQKYSAA